MTSTNFSFPFTIEGNEYQVNATSSIETECVNGVINFKCNVAINNIERKREYVDSFIHEYDQLKTQEEFNDFEKLIFDQRGIFYAKNRNKFISLVQILGTKFKSQKQSDLMEYLEKRMNFGVPKRFTISNINIELYPVSYTMKFSGPNINKEKIEKLLNISPLCAGPYFVINFKTEEEYELKLEMIIAEYLKDDSFSQLKKRLNLEGTTKEIFEQRTKLYLEDKDKFRSLVEDIERKDEYVDRLKFYLEERKKYYVRFSIEKTNIVLVYELLKITFWTKDLSPFKRFLSDKRKEDTDFGVINVYFENQSEYLISEENLIAEVIDRNRKDLIDEWISGYGKIQNQKEFDVFEKGLYKAKSDLYLCNRNKFSKFLDSFDLKYNTKYIHGMKRYIKWRPDINSSDFKLYDVGVDINRNELNIHLTGKEWTLKHFISDFISRGKIDSMFNVSFDNKDDFEKESEKLIAEFLCQ